MKKYLFPILMSAVLSACCCSNGDACEDGKTLRWDFDTAEGWSYSHQDDATIEQWKLVDGTLQLTTRALTRDRTKMQTLRNDFADGLYSWRIYIPSIAPGEQVSVAGFIYKDDEHELDFEVGYGTAAARESCGAAPGQLVACMTNQGFPYVSRYTPINPGWHNFSISLLETDGKYTARWIIDDEVKQEEELMFGTETQFRIYCSVENLIFIGDHIPEYNTSASFDWVSFTGPAASKNHSGSL